MTTPSDERMSQVNLDKLDEALDWSMGARDGRRDAGNVYVKMSDEQLGVLEEAARAFRDQERAKRPRVDLIDLARTMRARAKELGQGCVFTPDYEETAHLLDVLRTEVVPALERAADDRKPGLYSSESLKLLTALGLR